MYHFSFRRVCAVTLTSFFLALSASSIAEEEGVSPSTIEEIVVRVHPLHAEGLAQPVEILQSDELNRVRSPSIGETISALPGIRSSSFGQAVGRPIIRGLGGPRVKVMEDRIDSLDVSVSSPDHTITIEPLIAESIEVLKGPSTLLYGTSGIGGVVDVHTGRIPNEIPESLSGTIDARGDNNANTESFAVRLDGGSGNFAFHLDGFYRDANDYKIPGFAESLAQRAREEAEEDHHDEDHDDHEDEDHHDEDHDDHEDEDHHDEDHDDHEDEDHHDEDHEGEHGDDEQEAFGELPGSELKTEGGSFGLSYIGDRGYVGVSVSAYDARYGLPGHSHGHHGHHGHEDEDHEGEEHEGEDHEEEGHAEGEESPPILDLSQTRLDFDARLDSPAENISSVNLRVGVNDYEHTEFEEGEAGTTFKTESVEARTQLVHESVWGITGAAGLQISAREYSALGEEAFVEPVDTDSVGLFYVGQRKFGELSVESGLRYEDVEHNPTNGRKRSFDLTAISLGIIYPLSNDWTLTGQFDHSGRAPIAEELYSNGAHLATQSYERGDQTLEEEIATNLSVALSYRSSFLDFSLSVYETRFDDFIYQSNTGLEEDELPLLQWTQSDATFNGFEIEANWVARSWSGGSLDLSASYDRVRAQLDQGVQRDLPRIPPQRWQLGAILTLGDFMAELSYLEVGDQDNVAPNELATESYEDVRFYLGYDIEYAGSQIEIFLSGRNLTDDEQRYHTSFIKDLAPQPGRTVEAGFRIEW